MTPSLPNAISGEPSAQPSGKVMANAPTDILPETVGFDALLLTVATRSVDTAQEAKALSAPSLEAMPQPKFGNGGKTLPGEVATLPEPGKLLPLSASPSPKPEHFEPESDEAASDAGTAHKIDTVLDMASTLLKPGSKNDSAPKTSVERADTAALEALGPATNGLVSILPPRGETRETDPLAHQQAQPSVENLVRPTHPTAPAQTQIVTRSLAKPDRPEGKAEGLSYHQNPLQLMTGQSTTIHAPLPSALTIAEGAPAKPVFNSTQHDNAMPRAFESVVQSLSAAREAAQPGRAEMHLAHREFGHVNMQFELAGRQLKVALMNGDAEFAPAVQAAINERGAERQVNAVDASASAKNDLRQESQSSQQQTSSYAQSGASSSRQSQGEEASGNAGHSAANTRLDDPAEPSPAAADGKRDVSSSSTSDGLYA